MKSGERALTLGAIVMALCCAAGPVLAAVLGAGALTASGALGVGAAAVALVVVVSAILYRRRRGRSC